MSGRKIIATINIMPRVLWLDAASHKVRLLFGSVLDGMTNGNMEKAAVRMMPVIAVLLKRNAKRSNFHFALSKASAMPVKPANGANIIHG